MTAHLELLLILSDLSLQFCQHVDQGRAADCAALFAGSARLVFGPGSPKPGTIEGIEAIRGFFTARQALTHVTTRHVATNFRIQPISANEAQLDSLLTVFRSDDASREPVISVVCDIRERFVLTQAGQWLILERTTKPVFTHQP